MSDTKLCKHCQHRRSPSIPVPSCVSDPTNRKRLEWDEQWRQRIETKRQKEDEWADKKMLFGGEPWFYAWCDYKSRTESTARGDEVFQLAEAYYTEFHLDCPHFAHDSDAERRPATAAAKRPPSSPTGARNLTAENRHVGLDWENGGTF